MNLKVADLVRHAGIVLQHAGIDDARLEARNLVALVLDTSPDRITVISRDEVVHDAMARLNTLLTQRAEQRVPLSHLTGERNFFRSRFKVSADVLDPRPDTETLVEAALSVPFRNVLDLGTGSGCILLSLLAERRNATGIGTDISPKALAMADRNARMLGIADRCMLLAANWYDGVQGCFDLIVSNPPYIAASEMDDLAPELVHEPRMALTDDADGLSAYRQIVPGAATHLNDGGYLFVEIGWTQADAVRDIFTNTGFCNVSVIRDLEGRDRVLCGKNPPQA